MPHLAEVAQRFYLKYVMGQLQHCPPRTLFYVTFVMIKAFNAMIVKVLV
jgi:hypothetical protein